MKIIRYILLFYIIVCLQNCEDVVSPDIPESEPVLVVDAFLDNTLETQTVKITRSIPYFDQAFNPGISGANVILDNLNGGQFIFEESETGIYQFTPVDSSDVLGVVGDSFFLRIDLDGEQLESSSQITRVPLVDSVIFTFEEADAFISQDYYLGEVFARDFEGLDDTYWIKAYKNGVFLNKPSEINIAYDAGFSRGGGIDGLTFIQPLRVGISPFEEDPENDNEFLPPYEHGDSLSVEIHSISNETFDFLNEVRIQTDRPGGFAELFAVPLANVSSNIINTNGKTKVIGFFNVAAVTGGGATLDTTTVARE